MAVGSLLPPKAGDPRTAQGVALTGISSDASSTARAKNGHGLSHGSPSLGSPRIAALDGTAPVRSYMAASVHALALMVGWYVLSNLLSLYNKELLGHKYGFFPGEPFPAPILLCSLQFALQHVFARTAHALGVQRSAASEEATHWSVYVRTVLPNGVATGLDIALSNASFAFITLSFYTMCKASAPLFLLLFAFAWRLERPTWSLAGIVLVISSGLLMLVAGETQFDLTGFLLVMTAACLAGLRWTITQLSLQGGDSGGGHHVSKGTVLEVLEALTPVMSVTTGVASLLTEPLLDAAQHSAYFATYGHVLITAGLVLVSAVLAFFMVWMEFALIGCTSALTFMVAGVFKEIMTVLIAHLVFGDAFSRLNGIGLVVLVMGVCLFNWHKYARMRADAQRSLEGDESGGKGGGVVAIELRAARPGGVAATGAHGSGERVALLEATHGSGNGEAAAAAAPPKRPAARHGLLPVSSAPSSAVKAAQD